MYKIFCDLCDREFKVSGKYGTFDICHDCLTKHKFSEVTERYCEYDKKFQEAILRFKEDYQKENPPAPHIVDFVLDLLYIKNHPGGDK